MKVTLQALGRRRLREWPLRILTGVVIALAYTTVVLTPFVFLP